MAVALLYNVSCSKLLRPCPPRRHHVRQPEVFVTCLVDTLIAE